MIDYGSDTIYVNFKISISTNPLIYTRCYGNKIKYYLNDQSKSVL